MFQEVKDSAVFGFQYFYASMPQWEMSEMLVRERGALEENMELMCFLPLFSVNSAFLLQNCQILFVFIYVSFYFNMQHFLKVLSN